MVVVGLALLVALLAAFVAVLRWSQRDLERRMRRMVWPLVDAALALRDEQEH